MLKSSYNGSSLSPTLRELASHSRSGNMGSAMRNMVAGDYQNTGHPLANGEENARLYSYEQRVKAAFDAVVPALKRVSALQHHEDFETQAQQVAQQQLGFRLPAEFLADNWVGVLDMRRLFAWCVFETYRRFVDVAMADKTLATIGETEFQAWLQDCGFHVLDLSPCADGRLAHAVRYVLRLAPRAVRRRSYAGALFNVQDSLDKWTETELLRFREGRPNSADAPTRYLKVAVYHYSSVDPEHEGCAAHGSDQRRAAQAGLTRLLDFQRAVENSFCCGASIDLLLIGIDTDTDAIRMHLPDSQGGLDVDRFIDAGDMYEQTMDMTVEQGHSHILAKVQAGGQMSSGMARFITQLLVNNLSQIDYVQTYFGGVYPDTGHAERFIGLGKGFEEVHLRNLTYFSYLDTVEEAARDLDVGMKIFTRLNVEHGLPIPVVVRFDYPGKVPGARERAIAHCQRVANATHARFHELSQRGLLHTLQLVRDSSVGGRPEFVASSLNIQIKTGA